MGPLGARLPVVVLFEGRRASRPPDEAADADEAANLARRLAAIVVTFNFRAGILGESRRATLYIE